LAEASSEKTGGGQALISGFSALKNGQHNQKHLIFCKLLAS